MVNFNDLSEGPLLNNLRVRYKETKIYTWVSKISMLLLM
jgi:myosin heavy subunit